MDTVPFRISEVPISTLAAFMEAVATHQTDDLAEVAEFAGFGVSTARKVIPTLRSLGIIECPDDKPFRIMVDGVRRGMSEESSALVIRKTLQGYRPFEMLVEGIALGESTKVVVRKTAKLLGLPETDHGKLETLLRWGADLGILEKVDGSLHLAAELSVDRTDEAAGFLTAGDLASEARARLFNAERLGRTANNYLDEVDRQLLADAVLFHRADPRRSVDCSAQALEDYLRELADEKGFGAEARKANGAGQLAGVLVGKGVIHTHHQKLVEAPATVRNATSHRKDKRTLDPWEITPLGASAALAATLAAIRSIHEYVFAGRQTI